MRERTKESRRRVRGRTAVSLEALEDGLRVALGVRRISVGGTLARTAWSAFLAAATELASSGTVSRFANLANVDALLTTG